MLHFTTPSLERFSALAPDPEADLERLRQNLDRGSVRLKHLVVATTGDGTDVGRIGLYTHPDGSTVAFAQRVDPDRIDLLDVHGALFDGIEAAARSTGLSRIEITVVDADDPGAEAKRAALRSRGWEIDGDRLELEAEPVAGAFGPEIQEIDPSDPAVVRVMAAAMAASLDHHDQTQIAALGPQAAATGYRDMMANGPHPVPWLAHRRTDGGGGSGVAGALGEIVGVAAIQAYPTDWSLGYLAVDPRARRAGVGTALARAMLAATAAAGVPLATASVDTANPRIRGTLEKAAFTVRSARSDFVLPLDG